MPTPPPGPPALPARRGGPVPAARPRCHRRRLLAAGVLATAWALATACSSPAPPPHAAPASGRTGTPRLPGAPRHDAPRIAVPAATATCHPGVTGAEWWIMSSRELAVLQAAAPGAFHHAIQPADLLVLGGPRTGPRTGQAVTDFKSYAGFRHALLAGRVPPGTHWVMYDNEHWRRTPVIEQQHPGRYERLFARLAHAHGLKVILAPGQDLVQAFRPAAFSAGIAPWRRYLSLGLAAISARLADVYEIQAQPFELGYYRPGHTFRRDVTAAAAQARKASPGTAVFVGISTQRAATAGQLLGDYLAARGTAAGFWLNVPGTKDPHQQRLAEQFLRRLPAVAAAGRSCARQSAAGRPARSPLS